MNGLALARTSSTGKAPAAGVSARRGDTAKRTTSDAIDDATLSRQLEAGCRALGRPLDATEAHRLIAYLRLLERWNAVYNLTAIRDPAQMLTHHLLDCAAIVEPIERLAPRARTGHIVDVGSGAGLPGLVIAMLWPDAQVHLVERTEKKAAFQRQTIGALGLRNVSVEQQRIEQWQPPRTPDLIVCRAFASVDDFARSVDPIIGPDTAVIAMKGVFDDSERRGLRAPWRVADVIPLDVPGLDARRHLVRLERGDAPGRDPDPHP